MHSKPPLSASLTRPKDKRSLAIKEIEAWVIGDEENRVPEATRMSGQLAENVTEERMLRAKLLELGKERYRFMTQAEYDKAVFLEKQKRKSKLLRRALTQSARFIRRRTPNSSDWSVRSQDSRGHQGQQRSLPERPATTACPECESISLPPPRPKTVHFIPDDLTTAFHMRTGGTGDTDLSNDDGSYKRAQSDKLPSLKPTNTRLVQRPASYPAGEQLLKLPRPGSMSTDSGSVQSWARGGYKFCHLGCEIESCVDDPRYINLEEALVPVYFGSCTLDVQTIIDSIEALHMPSKMPSDSKPKMEQRLQDFMLERGIILFRR